MQSRCSFDFHAEIHVFRTGVGLLQCSGSDAVGKQAGWTQNYRNVSSRAGHVIGDGYVRKAAGRESAGDDGRRRGTSRAGGRLKSLGKQTSRDSYEHREAIRAAVGDGDVREAVLIEVRDSDAVG